MPKSKPAQRRLAADLIVSGIREVQSVPLDRNGRVQVSARKNSVLGYICGFIESGLESATLTTKGDHEAILNLAFSNLFGLDASSYLTAVGNFIASKEREFLIGHKTGAEDWKRLEAAHPEGSLVRIIRWESRRLATPELLVRLKEYGTRPAKYGPREFQRFHEVCLDIVRIERDVISLKELKPLFPGVEKGERLGGRGDYATYRKLETLIRTGRVSQNEARQFMADMFGAEYRRHMDYLFDAIAIVMRDQVAGAASFRDTRR